MARRRHVVLLAGLCGVACASALRRPTTLDDLARGLGAPLAVDRADGGTRLAAGAAAFERRPETEALLQAQRHFIAAARVQPARSEGLVGLIRVLAFRLDHELDAATRQRLAPLAVSAGQLCSARDPASAACDYWLAIALGLQARERPSTGIDGVRRMVELLKRAAARDASIEEAGPERVLALVYLRAPGWPAGPGDDEEGLRLAQRAVALRPEHPPNVLALAEALRKNGRREEAHAVYTRARVMAAREAAEGHPDAPEWQREAEQGLAGPDT
jgi:hypothetical protein